MTQVGITGLGVERATLVAALKTIEAEEEAATEYLAAIREQLAERGVVTTTEVVTGEVVPEILEAARPRDLLVMTTHGRAGLARGFFGSVAEVVIRRSPVPVLVVGRLPYPEGHVYVYLIAPSVGWEWFAHETAPVVQATAHLGYGKVLGLYLYRRTSRAIARIQAVLEA